MMPLTLDDLLPLEEYANRRREFFNSLGKYLDRYRRVRIGPKVTLLFENRQTLWFRVHEIIRIARLADSEKLQSELDWYNSLLPGPNTLQAAMLIDIEDDTQLTSELAPFQEFSGNELELHVGGDSIPATLITNRQQDMCIGAAHWIQFRIDRTTHRQLADFRQRAYLELILAEYQHESAPLNDEIRQSLIDDLELSNDEI